MLETLLLGPAKRAHIDVKPLEMDVAGNSVLRQDNVGRVEINVAH